ncbi:BON domain-containing protein [Dyella sp. KRB-257]|uniref:BON domain-containing protein n=1 Tax=Dyella sp. KRB-257 TaxID=3400915 RepID=UPI003C030CEA
MANRPSNYQAQYSASSDRYSGFENERAPRRQSSGAHAGSSGQDYEDMSLARPWREDDPLDGYPHEGHSFGGTQSGNAYDERSPYGDRERYDDRSYASVQHDYPYERGHETPPPSYEGGYRGDLRRRGYRGWDEERGAPWMTQDGRRATGPEAYRGGRSVEPWPGTRRDDVYSLQGGDTWGTPQEGYLSEPYGDGGQSVAQERQQRHDRFRGQGPKGYRRTDERIHEDVCEALAHDPHVDASEMEVKVKDGVVTLEGEIPSRHMKHRAENCADSCSGVKDVDNRLRVRKPSSPSGNSAVGGRASADGEGAGSGVTRQADRE